MERGFNIFNARAWSMPGTASPVPGHPSFPTSGEEGERAAMPASYLHHSSEGDSLQRHAADGRAQAETTCGGPTGMTPTMWRLDPNHGGAGAISGWTMPDTDVDDER